MAKYQGKYSRNNREYAELEKSYKNLTPAQKARKKKAEALKRRNTIIAVCVGVICLAIAILVGCILLINSDQGKIIDNVYIAGVNVGGMTKADAEKAVRKATKGTYGSKKMEVTVLDETVTIPADAVKDLDIESAVEDAYKLGHSGNTKKREQVRKQAASKGYYMDLTTYLTIDKKAIMNELNKLGEIYNSTLVKTVYRVDGEKPTIEQIQKNEGMQTLVIDVGYPEYGLNMDKLYNTVMNGYSNNEFTVEGKCEMIDPTDLDLNAILEEYYIAPVNAEVKEGSEEIIAEKYGYGFDLELVEKKIREAEYGTSVSIEFIRIAPEVRTEDIIDDQFKDQLGTWTAKGKGDDNRRTNLRLACEAIDGVVLNPGDTFSYNKALGERTEARGYKPGPSYVGNETVYTVGGGICQVSSALYYCAMQADLEIVYRDNHGFAQAYVPLGMDATVSWGSIDFLFKNNSNHAIRISATADGDTTTVSIYGINDKDYTVELEYEILSETECHDEYKEMSADNKEGYKDGDYIIDPYNGYTIQTYRCKYDKDGNLISREKEAYSSYRVRNGLVCKIIDETAE